MERMLVVVFDTQDNANDGSHVLQDLDTAGLIAVHAARIVTKGADGSTFVNNTRDGLPDAAMGGTALGTLIGMLGGPVGLAIGAAGGLVAGAAADFSRDRIAADFFSDVERSLQPGKSAVVAEIDEEDTDAVDARMHALGGFVIRRAFEDLADPTWERETDALRQRITRTKQSIEKKWTERSTR
jgi:uncharacterized membrane protein